MFWKKKKKIEPGPPPLTPPELWEDYMKRVRLRALETEAILDQLDQDIIQEYRNLKKEEK